MSLKDLLIEKIGEKGIVDIIIEMKRDMERLEIKNMKIELFDLAFGSRLSHYTLEQLYEKWFNASEILRNFDNNKFNIHDAYHNIDIIKKEIDIKRQLMKLEKKLLEYEGRVLID